MPGLGSAVGSRWVGWGTGQALGPEDFVRLGELWQQGWRGASEPRTGARIPTMAFWRKLFSYLPPLTSPHCWDCGCNEMSQIPSLMQPLMLALHRFCGLSQAVFGQRGLFGMSVCQCWVWRVGVSEFRNLHGHVPGFSFHNRELASETLFTLQIPNKQPSYQ